MLPELTHTGRQLNPTKGRYKNLHVFIGDKKADAQQQRCICFPVFINI